MKKVFSIKGNSIKCISILPLVMFSAVLLAVCIHLLSELYGYPAFRQTISPDAGVSIIDPGSAFYSAEGLSPNTADIDTLCILPGVGEKTAREFIIQRELNGPFVFPEDLLSVKGIGEKKLEKIVPLITLP